MIVPLPETAKLTPPTEREFSHHMRRAKGRWAAAYQKAEGWDAELLPSTVGRGLVRLDRIVACGKSWGIPTAFWPVDNRNQAAPWPEPSEE